MSLSPQPNPIEANPVVLLNAPVVTSEGVYRFEQISPEEARSLVHRQGFKSAIGPAPTALVLSELLNVDCPMNRVEFRQQPGQVAIVFRLARRLEEGRILVDRFEIEQIGFSFALLTREE